MNIDSKKKIKNILEPYFLEKGFVYDESRSKLNARWFVFSKGDPEPPMEGMEKFIKGTKAYTKIQERRCNICNG